MEAKITPSKYFHLRLCEATLDIDIRYIKHIKERQIIQLLRWPKIIGIITIALMECH